MEFLYEYGLFLAKAVTIVVSLAIVISIVAGAAIKQKPGKGHLEALVHEHLSAHRSQRGAGTEWFKVSVQQATETIINAIALYDLEHTRSCAGPPET